MKKAIKQKKRKWYVHKSYLLNNYPQETNCEDDFLIVCEDIDRMDDNWKLNAELEKEIFLRTKAESLLDRQIDINDEINIKYKAEIDTLKDLLREYDKIRGMLLTKDALCEVIDTQKAKIDESIHILDVVVKCWKNAGKGDPFIGIVRGMAQEFIDKHRKER